MRPGMKSGLHQECRCRPRQNCHSFCIAFIIIQLSLVKGCHEVVCPYQLIASSLHISTKCGELCTSCISLHPIYVNSRVTGPVLASCIRIADENAQMHMQVQGHWACPNRVKIVNCVFYSYYHYVCIVFAMDQFMQTPRIPPNVGTMWGMAGQWHHPHYVFGKTWGPIQPCSGPYFGTEACTLIFQTKRKYFLDQRPPRFGGKVMPHQCHCVFIHALDPHSSVNTLDHSLNGALTQQHESGILHITYKLT